MLKERLPSVALDLHNGYHLLYTAFFSQLAKTQKLYVKDASTDKLNQFIERMEVLQSAVLISTNATSVYTNILQEA